MFLQGVPVAQWIDYNNHNKKITLQLYFSDVLRVASLYKFGGTYIDTDVITLAKHPDVKNYLNFEEPGDKITTIF